MRRNRSLDLSLILTLAAAVALVSAGCAKKEAPAEATAAQTAAPTPAGGGKIPITTSSPEAKAAFLQGRDQFEKLLITDSVAHFQKAVELDANFASAELALANSAPTGKEFFEHLNKAVALADKASSGERLLILATSAGANNDATKQKQDLEELVAAYPNDERAHFNLGGYYFGQQEYPQAIEHYKKATELDPTYSSAFNLLGYAYRQNVDYANAETAFQKYVTLIPKDPNPYDSYAELLLKMGRYDDSIAQYRKALEIDPNFINAHQGIAMDLLYQGKAAQASAELTNIANKARNDGERRTGLFAQTVVLVDSGKAAEAMANIDKQYALAEKNHDAGAMSFDRATQGNIFLEIGKPDQAAAAYAKALAIIEGSNLSQDLKDNAKLISHYNLARVAAAKKDFATAKKEADVYRAGATVSKNPFQVKNAHELDGIIALAEKNYDVAITELAQSNQQNPQDLYRLCQAYGGKGDAEKAAAACKQAAQFNSLPAVNYAFVRTKAAAASGGKS
jgi:tetratricopeptide (TPR) repeat protein